MRILSLVIGLLAVVPLIGVSADVSYPWVADTFAVASCHRTGPNSEAAFARIATGKPRVFLFLGDNIYGDTRDMQVLDKKYQALGAVAMWQQLKAHTTVLPIWDDHDYGENDAGIEYPMKKESALLFFDFFGFPADHPARTRGGVYHSAMFGPGGKRVQLVLLDARSFRSPLRRERVGTRKEYVPDPDAGKSMLGADQWQWLEKQLAEPADVRMICSGIQMLPEEHAFEKWANLPLERAKLLAVLAKTNGKLVLLSGDRHMAEISTLTREGKTFVELTTSGMTHAGGGRTSAGEEPNRHRVGKVYSDLNSGTVDITWRDGAEPSVKLRVIGADGKEAMAHAW